MMTSLNAAVKKTTQCSASCWLYHDVGIGWEGSVLANLELKRTNLIKGDVFMNPCWALLFVGVSGMTSARSRVTHLVLPAWSSFLQWPLEFSTCKTPFLPSYHSTPGTE